MQIRDLNIAKQTQDIGFYAGFVGEFFDKHCSTSVSICPKESEHSSVWMFTLNYICISFIYQYKLMVHFLSMKALHICVGEQSPQQYGESWLISMEGNRLSYWPLLQCKDLFFFWQNTVTYSIVNCNMGFYFGFSFADAPKFWAFFLLYFRVIFNTLFGLSSNYWMALITRCLLGVMCGYLGPIKVPKHMVTGTDHHLRSLTAQIISSIIFCLHSTVTCF